MSPSHDPHLDTAQAPDGTAVAHTRIAKVLADQPFFSSMPVTMIRRLAAHAYNAEFAAGAYLFREGEAADRFFIVRTGTVRLDMEIAGRGRVEVEELSCDAALGWSWLFPPFQWHLGARAITSTKVIAFDAAVLRTVMAADPVIGYELMRRFAAVMFDRLQTTRRCLTESGAHLPFAAVAGPWAGKQTRAITLD
jgi:CRP/FNR family cyclic AMP-dependent transcriptional regulator